MTSALRCNRAVSVLAVGVACLAVSQLVPQASAQRAKAPDRIGLYEPFGGSDFAESLHNLSEQGLLNGSTQTGPITQPGIIYRRPWYRYGYGHHPYGHRHYTYYDPFDIRFQFPYGIDGRVVSGHQPGSNLSRPQPTAAVPTQQADTPPPTPLEQARLDIRADELDEAIDGYRRVLVEDESNYRVAAELAVALIADGRFDDGVSMMRLAYGSDPGLANEPVSRRLELGAKQWRELVVRTVRHAHRRGTPSAWLAVTVLMQAQGRPEVAMRMLDRARDLGLEDEIATPLAAVLRS